MSFSKTYTLSEIPEIAKKIVERAKGMSIWVFDGQMGAGKTTLIKAIAKEMSVSDTVQSPTFAIVNEYCTLNHQTIYHFDFYRLKHPTEALDFGVEEYFDSGSYCFIEWAEKIGDLLPENHVLIKIDTNSSDSRILSIEMM